ncbi:uncharacterized protein LOC129583486 [Paramacrobiotus metropolitanus]|uniref:uncharacterized protein LOC129583486 n=1 Tax=Paramacrobiotus metropolitanus TaxID=2943436 RepID=UPI00244642D3|nr:uncharacterized protein LOC129583486 [Paramacrobiotus metropolitanus]
MVKTNNLEAVVAPWFFVMYIFGFGSFRQSVPMSTAAPRFRKGFQIFCCLFGIFCLIGQILESTDLLCWNLSRLKDTTWSAEQIVDVFVYYQTFVVIVVGSMYLMATVHHWLEFVHQIQLKYGHHLTATWKWCTMTFIVAASGRIIYTAVKSVFEEVTRLERAEFCIPVVVNTRNSVTKRLKCYVKLCALANTVGIDIARYTIAVAGFSVGYCFGGLSIAFSERFSSTNYLEDLLQDHAALGEMVFRFDRVVSPVLFAICMYALTTLMNIAKRIMLQEARSLLELLPELIDITLLTWSLIYLAEQAGALKKVLQKFLQSPGSQFLDKYQRHRFAAHLHRLTFESVGMTLLKTIVIDRGFVVTIISAAVTYMLLFWELREKQFGESEMKEKYVLRTELIANITCNNVR